MTPLALAAVGECLNEQAGTVNVAWKGSSSLLQFWGCIRRKHFESGLCGLLLGSATGALIGLVFGVVCVYGKANQVIAGMG